ncbi:MAG: hypothetical protein AAFV33_11330 [Chloroflexota bacterium]
MTLSLPDDLAREITETARQRQQSPEDLLRQVWQHYRAAADTPTTPAQVRQRVYARARAYWQAHGVTDLLQLTDADLDAQFAFIDAGGVPHLKADAVNTPTTPLEGLLGVLDTDATDLSAAVSDTLHRHFRGNDDRPD